MTFVTQIVYLRAIFLHIDSGETAVEFTYYLFIRRQTDRSNDRETDVSPRRAADSRRRGDFSSGPVSQFELALSRHTNNIIEAPSRPINFSRSAASARRRPSEQRRGDTRFRERDDDRSHRR